MSDDHSQYAVAALDSDGLIDVDASIHSTAFHICGMQITEKHKGEHYISSPGEIVLTTSKNSISVDDLVKRLEALEQAYMELLLMGKKDVNVD